MTTVAQTASAIILVVVIFPNKSVQEKTRELALFSPEVSFKLRQFRKEGCGLCLSEPKCVLEPRLLRSFSMVHDRVSWASY